MKAHDRLHEADRAAREGRYEEALEGYIWFHSHSLAEEPGLYGVRLSFALSHWIDLGEKYRPARDALIGIRDKSAMELARGADDRDLFHDVVSINDNLQDMAATAELFHLILKRSPAFAAKCSSHARPSLVATGQYGLAREYLPDPGSSLAHLPITLNYNLSRAKSRTESEHRKIRRWAHLRGFIDDARLILLIVKLTDGANSADILREGLLMQIQDGNAKRSLKKYLADDEKSQMPAPHTRAPGS